MQIKRVVNLCPHIIVIVPVCILTIFVQVNHPSVKVCFRLSARERPPASGMNETYIT